jgi:hypothetical protein
VILPDCAKRGRQGHGHATTAFGIGCPASAQTSRKEGVNGRPPHCLFGRGESVRGALDDEQLDWTARGEEGVVQAALLGRHARVGVAVDEQDGGADCVGS